MQTNLSIGDKAIKMALLQTIPGHEFEVIKSLKIKLDAMQKEPFAIFKGFGSFDIIIIYQTPSFGYHLTKIGPLNSILKSNLFLCFPHVGEDCDRLFETIQKTSLLGISLLKLDTAYSWEHPEIEISLVEHWRKESTDSESIHFLGTLGWNELVVLVAGEKFNNIIERVHSLVAPGLILGSENNVLPAFTKTYSFLNLNYKAMPIDSFAKSKQEAIVPFFESFEPLSSQEIEKDNPPTIRISCRPVYSSKIVNYWERKGYEAKIAFGKDDIIVKPNNPHLWSGFVSDLLTFRCKFQSNILSTNTLLRTAETFDSDNLPVTQRHPVSLPKFKIKDLEDIFGNKWGDQLANDLFTLNQLLQNPIVGDAYVGMSKFPTLILKRGSERKLQSSPFRFDNPRDDHLATNCSQIMKIGAELRSYGTYGTIEEVSGRFSRAKGGAQRSIFAIEYLIKSVLQRLDTKWEGFVIAGGTSYYHAVEVINIPLDALWDPRDWWGVYHEIAHVIIDHASSHFGSRVKVINSFLTQKDRPEWWLYLLNELAAEVIGYEIGFLGDFDLFMKKLYAHLYPVTNTTRNPGVIETYLFRTFFTELYDKLINRQEISENDWRDTSYLFENMIQHMIQVEKLSDGNLVINDKEFIAGKSLFTLRDLLGYANHIRMMTDEIDNYKIDINVPDSNSDKILKSIGEGEVYWGDIECVERLMHKVTMDGQLSFSSKIATILTFNAQRLKQLNEEYAI